MRLLQFSLALLAVAIPYFEFATAYFPTSALGLTTTCLFGFVASSRHQASAPANSHAENSPSIHDGCYGWTPLNKSAAHAIHPGLISWSDLASIDNQTNVATLNHTFEALCAELASHTFNTGQNSFNCLANNRTSRDGVYGEYSVIASMTYLGPDATFDMAGNYNYCLATMAQPRACPKGGYFSNVSLPWSGVNGTGQCHGTQYWNVRAQAVVSPCRTLRSDEEIDA